MREDHAGVVVASDSPSVRSLCARAAHGAGLSRVRYALPSAASVLDALREFTPRIVVLEARFPGRAHVELFPLRALRDAIGSSVDTAVVVVTSSEDRALERSVHAIGVDAFWRLPIDVSAFRENLAWLCHRGAAAQPDTGAVAPVTPQIEPNGYEVDVETCRPVRGTVLEALCAMQELAAPALAAHAQRVACLTQELCQALDLGRSYAMSVGAGALLHDIGHLPAGRSVSLKVPARGSILAGQPGESAEHLAVGRSFLDRFGRKVPFAVREVVVHHHERWDGRGRPTGYAGHEIPFAARIVAVCDVFDDALRDALQALEPREAVPFAIERTAQAAGSVLDSDLVDALAAVVDDGIVTGLQRQGEPCGRGRDAIDTMWLSGR